MSTLRQFAAAVVALGMFGAAVHALDGMDGYETAALFDAADVEALTEWSDIDVRLSWAASGGAVLQEEMTIDSAGNVYVYAWGDDSNGDWWNGVVRFDPETETLDTVILGEFFFLDPVSQTGWYDNLDCITISPVSAGKLSKDHLVIVRNLYDAASETYSLEVSSVDPDTSAETVVLTAAGGGPDATSLVIDGSNGDIFLLDARAGSAPDWGAIRRFHWNGSGYTQTTVTTVGTAMWGLAMGPDGYLYSFDGTRGTPDRIIRIDPASTDSFRQYASLENTTQLGSRFRGWSFDSAGAFWIALHDLSTKRGKKGPYAFVCEIVEGGTVRFADRIAEGDKDEILAFTAGLEEKLYVLDDSRTVWGLAKDSEGGGGKPPKKPKK
jgi:hypothetical protein